MKSIKIQDLILFEDDDYFVVNKPPFLSTLDDRVEKNNMLALARGYIESAQVGHRLDKDTSGVLAIAKNPEAYRHLSIQFEQREVTKVYHAVVDGIHAYRDVLVDKAILKQNDGTVRLSKSEGKPAQTHFNTLQSFRLHTLVECRPVTGRMHQIRIHLASLNSPITGDDMYGGKPFFLSSVKRGFNLKKSTDEQPIMKRMALHAYSLKFIDLKGNEQTVEASYPKDMQALVKQLETNR